MGAKETCLIYSNKSIHIRKMKQPNQTSFVHVALVGPFIDEQKTAFEEVSWIWNMQIFLYLSAYAKIGDCFEVGWNGL